MMITLDILSDPICPWCFIGKQRLDRALQERPGHPLSVRWRPFQLNPSMPPEGVDRRGYLETKFGGAEGAAKVYGAIAQAAKDDGLELKLDDITRTPNTIDAHRLLSWAAEAGVQHEASEGLFVRYFQRAQDISSHEVLADIAEEVGMDRDVVLRLLKGDAEREAILKADGMAREMGVNSAPTFILHGRHVLPGAHETSFWLQIIDDLTQKLNA